MNVILKSDSSHLTSKSEGMDIDLGRRKFMTLASSLAVGAGCLLSPGSVLGAYKGNSLEHSIDAYIKKLRRKGVIRPDERTAWSIYDFNTGKKLVSINENVSYQSASMIKPFVALAYFYKVQQDGKRYKYTPKIRSKMEAMIKSSSNSATNYVMRLVSNKPVDQRPKEVERILKKNAPGIFRDTRIVEYIPKGGKTYRNKASASDYSRFLYAIWNDLLPFSREIKRLMALENRDRISFKVNNIPPGTKVYDKTGSTAKLCGNMGVIEALGKDGKTYPYTFIGIIEKRRGAKSYSRWVTARSDLIRKISGMVYSELKSMHPLV